MQFKSVPQVINVVQGLLVVRADEALGDDATKNGQQHEEAVGETESSYPQITLMMGKWFGIAKARVQLDRPNIKEVQQKLLRSLSQLPSTR